MDTLNQLLDKMEAGSLVPHLAINQDNVQSALEHRDNPRFDEPWMKAFRQVEASKGGKHDADSRVTRLRELAYLQAYHRWGSPELAAYISDDFGLIGDALATGHSEGLPAALLATYESLQFPHGQW